MLFEAGHETDHGSSLALKYLINDAGYVTSVAHGPVVHHASTTRHAASWVPAPTLVSDPGGGDLEIKLIWDSSVARAPSGFTRTVVAAAELYVQEFATTIAAIGNEVISIQVGYGELAGSAMSPAALGESESPGLLTGYAAVTHALEREGYSFKAANEPGGGQFFVTSAEAKALGLIDPASRGVDGFVGFSTLAGTGYHWNLSAASSCSTTGTGTRPRQFDLESVVWHEISEVMGRIGLEGELVNGHATYTPLDLFDFKSPGELALSSAGGYFSVDNGRTPLGRYNNAAVNGGDISDWASALTVRQSATEGRVPGTQDAFDAFAFPGIDGNVSLSDLAEVASLGYGSLGVAEALV